MAKTRISQTPAWTWETARMTIGLISLLSLIGIAVSLLGGNMNFPFSVYASLLLAVSAAELAVSEGDSSYYVIGLILSLLILVPYIIGYFRTKKRGGWMTAVLVLWCLDTILPVITVSIFGILVHVLGVWALAQAVKVRRSVFAPVRNSPPDSYYAYDSSFRK